MKSEIGAHPPWSAPDAATTSFVITTLALCKVGSLCATGSPLYASNDVYVDELLRIPLAVVSASPGGYRVEDAMKWSALAVATMFSRTGS
jgi:hypothetical protein